MTEWFSIRVDLMRRPEIAKLKPKQFRRRMLAAMAGEQNEFTQYLKGPFYRPPSHEWKALRAAVFDRDDYRCRYCGERGGRLECDHVVPVALGGGGGLDNLVTACQTCNRLKRAKLVKDWLR